MSNELLMKIFWPIFCSMILICCICGVVFVVAETIKHFFLNKRPNHRQGVKHEK